MNREASQQAVSLRLPGDIHRLIQRCAQENRRSMNSEIIVLLERALEKEKADAGATASA